MVDALGARLRRTVTVSQSDILKWNYDFFGGESVVEVVKLVIFRLFILENRFVFGRRRYGVFVAVKISKILYFVGIISIGFSRIVRVVFVCGKERVN